MCLRNGVIWSVFEIQIAVKKYIFLTIVTDLSKTARKKLSSGKTTHINVKALTLMTYQNLLAEFD